MDKKFEYERQNWNGGVLRFQADTLDEIKETLKRIDNGTTSHQQQSAGDGEAQGSPILPGGLTCAGAIRTLLADPEWSREARTEGEVTKALSDNAYHYSRGTISGLLIQMLRRNELRRPTKKNGSWAYVLNRSKNPENQDN